EEAGGISSDSDSDGELEMYVVTGRHDIPVREDTRPAGCFKTNKRHHAMYPFHEERPRADDYGEIIRPEDYRLAEVMDAEGEIRDVPPAVNQKPEPQEAAAESPSKCVTSVRQVAVRASVQYIELEGRCDGESLLRVVAAARPRAVAPLRAEARALRAVQKYCESEGIEKIFVPNKGDIIDATTESHIYQTVSESARVKISATRVDSKNERGEWRLWRAPRAVRSGWRPEARPGRAARPPSPRVTSSEQLRASPNLSDDRTSEPREREIVLVVGFLSDG
ncbi:hypothetical protein ACJJTC_002774, partial [Scirpophaga incertulas]